LLLYSDLVYFVDIVSDEYNTLQLVSLKTKREKRGELITLLKRYCKATKEVDPPILRSILMALAL
jgi:hypothetical protein